MSIPLEPSLFQDEVQVFNDEPCKWLSGPDVGTTKIKFSSVFFVGARSCNHHMYRYKRKLAMF